MIKAVDDFTLQVVARGHNPGCSAPPCTAECRRKTKAEREAFMRGWRACERYNNNRTTRGIQDVDLPS